mmetsp:Transcript_30609/g.53842  ORF Transcript_30609/g.53842 Transcript_30609/m.53842 type:complete len:145 (+) Transcript_30609:93-527(+)
MGWLPDHVWMAQKMAKKGGGKGGGKDMMMPMMMMMMGGKGGYGKGSKIKQQSKQTMQKVAKMNDEEKVWLGGLPKGLTWKELEKFVEETAGTKPKITNIMSFGTAVVVFTTADEATAAIAALSGAELKGKTLEADVWTKKEKKA